MLDPFHLQWVNKLYRKHKSVGVIFPYRKYIKIAKKSDFCEELLSENDFEVVLVNFCCYEYGDNASKAVQKQRLAQGHCWSYVSSLIQLVL